MPEEHRDIIKDSIKDLFSLQEKFSDFEVNSNFQLLISQLDLFKIIASLVVGIIGIGYLNNPSLSNNFLLISLILALTTFILSISYTREVIDSQQKLNEDTHLLVATKVKEHNEIALRALRENNSDIFFNYATAEQAKIHPKQQLNWMGEIIIFFLYLSVGFLCLSFISPVIPIKIISCPTLILLFVVCLISFKDWTILFSKKINFLLNKLTRS